MKLYFLILYLFFALAESTDVVESQNTNVEPENLKTSRDSPFLACRDSPGAISDSKKLWGFYQGLQRAVSDEVKRRVAESDLWLSCYDKSKTPGSPFCPGLRHWQQPTIYPKPVGFDESPRQQMAQDKTLPDILKKARMHHSLGSWNHVSDPSDWFTLDRKLELHGGSKQTQWEPISEDESMTAAKNRLNGYIREGQKHFGISNSYLTLMRQNQRVPLESLGSRPSPLVDRAAWDDASKFQFKRAQFGVWLKAKRRGHFALYQKIIGDYPIVSYLSSPTPDDREIIEATKKIRLNAQMELARIKNLGKRYRLKSGVRISRDEMATDFSELLLYRSIAEKFLTQNPEYCGVAIHEFQRREMRERIANKVQSLALGPVLAASILAPPAYIIGMGLTVGGLALADAHDAKKRAIRDSLSAPTRGIDHLYTPEEIDEFLSDFYSEAILLPAAFVGSGATLRGMKRAISPRGKKSAPEEKN